MRPRTRTTRRRERATPRDLGSSHRAASTPGAALLDHVAEATRLAEGPEGVRRVLRIAYLEGPIPIRNLARRVRLPVPVVAAIRGELESRGLLKREAGIALSAAGGDVVSGELGIACRRQLATLGYAPVPDDLAGVRDRLSEICEARPSVDVSLDQSHALPETSVRRALYLQENDALEGRDVIVLGDDDLTSVAINLVSKSLSLRIRRLVVLERDPRLVAFLRELAENEAMQIEVVEHDLREELPPGLPGAFDVFATDPPYTLEGLSLFASRGVSALRGEPGKQGYISFGYRRPAESAAALGMLADMGLAAVEVLPEFNHYEGAQMLAGVSQMIHTVSTGDPDPKIRGEYRGDLYTADRRRNKKRGR